MNNCSSERETLINSVTLEYSDESRNLIVSGTRYSKAYVLERIVANNIEPVCSLAKGILEGFEFDSTPYRLNRDDPKILHIIECGANCIPDHIIESAITIICESYAGNVETLLSKAKALRVLVVTGKLNISKVLEMAKVLESKALAVFKYIGDLEDPDYLLAIFDQLKSLPCLLEMEYDGWDGSPGFIGYFVEFRPKTQYTLRHKDGHKVILKSEGIFRVKFVAKPEKKLIDIIPSVMKELPDGISLSIICDDTTKTNKPSEIIPVILKFGTKVKHLDLSSFTGNILDSVKDNADRFKKEMPELTLLNIGIQYDRSYGSYWVETIGHHLRQFKWPADLHYIGLVPNECSDFLKEWEFSHKISIEGSERSITYLLVSDSNTKPLFLTNTFVSSGTQKKAYAHSIKCSAIE